MDEAAALTWAEQALGHRFRDPGLLTLALTHPTYAYEHGGESNQRLEFLGDAVVELAVSDYLYRHLAGAPEGELTRVRAAVVAAPTLARRARALGVGPMLRLGRGEELIGGRDRDSNLADAFEALVAAIYLDAGLEAARAFVLRELAPEVEAAVAGHLNPNYKARLLEWAQREHREPPRYEVVAEEGPDHARRYRVRVLVAGRALGTGEGSSKREAEQEAARQALAHLGL
ncbi:MAG: ribonuclease III [Bacillota bacterium]|nr:MAG: ribonuclease III [Bacillota bacterium]